MTARLAALALAAALAACSSPPSRVEAPMPTSAREMLAARLSVAAIQRVARMTDAEVAAELVRPGGTDAAKGKRRAEAAPPPGRLAPFAGAPFRANLLSRT